MDTEPAFETKHGRLYQADCLEVLADLPRESVSLFFADPPFNLGKNYGPRVNDGLGDDEYVRWCQAWLAEGVRLLKPGGSLFLYNLPKWNIRLAQWLEQHLRFRHWIAVDLKNRLPIRGRLYPAHYSLLYFTKGQPETFNPPRLPLTTCRHCGGETKDYGGYKDRMRLEGITLSDVWSDLSPVRPRKPLRSRPANVLPMKMMDRVLDIASKEGDLVLDPFAGSGTTLVAAELKHRRWVGIELETVAPIVDRFANPKPDQELMMAITGAKNRLLTDRALALGLRNGRSFDRYGAQGSEGRKDPTIR